MPTGTLFPKLLHLEKITGHAKVFALCIRSKQKSNTRPWNSNISQVQIMKPQNVKCWLLSGVLQRKGCSHSKLRVNIEIIYLVSYT
jgi:hypothetical protein